MKLKIKLPRVKIDRRILIVFAIAVIIAGLIIAINWYLNATKEIEVTSVVVDKYTREVIDYYTNVGTEDDPIRIPVYKTNFYLVLENKSRHLVSQSRFDKYQIGDSYTYKTRVWK